MEHATGRSQWSCTLDDIGGSGRSGILEFPYEDRIALLAVLLGIPPWKPFGSSQAARAIRTAALGTDCSASTGGLSTGWSSPALQEGQALGNVHLGACFPLRCIQRLSQPTIATRRCAWQHNRDTSGSSDSVLSY